MVSSSCSMISNPSRAKRSCTSSTKVSISCFKLDLFDMITELFKLSIRNHIQSKVATGKMNTLTPLNSPSDTCLPLFNHHSLFFFKNP
ncbi:hypothetical protein YC2023_043875 [Brassica napus]